jgi:hypothetical protein
MARYDQEDDQDAYLPTPLRIKLEALRLRRQHFCEKATSDAPREGREGNIRMYRVNERGICHLQTN